jgi:hypothetical protein
VVNGFVALGAGADDFGFERDDPRIKFGNRKRIKVELDQEGERVAGTRWWRDVVGIHSAMVKGAAGAVNLGLCQSAGRGNLWR